MGSIEFKPGHSCFVIKSFISLYNLIKQGMMHRMFIITTTLSLIWSAKTVLIGILLCILIFWSECKYIEYYFFCGMEAGGCVCLNDNVLCEVYHLLSHVNDKGCAIIVFVPRPSYSTLEPYLWEGACNVYIILYLCVCMQTIVKVTYLAAKRQFS